MHHAATRAGLGATIAMIATLAPAETSHATFGLITKIYVGASLDAAADHRILFDQGLVYDLPQIDTRYVTLYDPAQKRVTMLDRQTQVQTTLGTDDLLRLTAQARAAAGTPDRQDQLGLNATVRADERGSGYSLAFGDLETGRFEYLATAQAPPEPEMAREYGQFADWASRLNLIRRLGPPPFGRMTLNRHLTRAGQLPLEVTLRLRRGDKTEEFRSTHEWVEMTEADRVRIKEVRGMATLYKEVPLVEFP